MSLKRDVEFMYELGALRLIPRQWSRFHLSHVQNLAEHHYRVVWLALLIAAREGQGDPAKIMKMAIVHDIAESRTGDVDYIARQYVDRNEDQAIKDMLKDTALEKDFLAIIQEYEKRESIEAKIVKDADNLDVDMDLREQGTMGHQLTKDWIKQRKFVGDNKLYTKTARHLHAAIWADNPHDWHIKSPSNRLNGGDWKK
jgi:putative hydrolases of HD superfamily